MGDKVAVTIVDAYDGSSNYIQVFPFNLTCEFGVDLVQGQVLQATVVDSTNNGIDDRCNTGIATIAPFSNPTGNWTWNPAGQQSAGPGSEILAGSYRADNGSCQASVGIDLTVYGKDPFAPSVQGHVPNVILKRFLIGSGSGPSCPMQCAGNFVVNLKKL